jgi:hypothetical protein
MLLLPEPPGGLKLYYNVGELKKDLNLDSIEAVGHEREISNAGR